MLLNCGVEKTLQCPLDYKEIQPINPKGNQSWIFIGRTDAEAETPVLWPPDVKKWVIGKDPDTGKNWRQEEKGMTEDEMVGWHRWLDGHEFEQALAVGNGQGSLVCYSLWGYKVSDMTEWLNCSELITHSQVRQKLTFVTVWAVTQWWSHVTFYSFKMLTSFMHKCL